MIFLIDFCGRVAFLGIPEDLGAGECMLFGDGLAGWGGWSTDW